jgi:hypothetical protein
MSFLGYVFGFQITASIITQASMTVESVEEEEAEEVGKERLQGH